MTGRGGQWRLGPEHRRPSALPLPPNVARAPRACIPMKPTQPLTCQALWNIPDSGTDLPSGGARSLGLGSDQRRGDGTRRVGRQVGPRSPQLWSPEVWSRPCKGRKNSAGENSAQNHAALTKQILLLLKKTKNCSVLRASIPAQRPQPCPQLFKALEWLIYTTWKRMCFNPD